MVPHAASAAASVAVDKEIYRDFRCVECQCRSLLRGVGFRVVQLNPATTGGFSFVAMWREYATRIRVNSDWLE